MTNTLNVRNARQAALFHCELQGQISDGKWENTANTGWEQWCRATAVVDPSNVGRDFYARKDNFQLNAKDLLEVVGGRMLVYARLADEGFTSVQIRALDSLFSCDGEYRGLPTYEGKYWDGVRKQIAEMMAVNPNLLNVVEFACGDDTGYGMKELNEDLRDLRKIFKTQR